MTEQTTITAKVRVGLDELIRDYRKCWSWHHETFEGFLSEKVAEELDQDLDGLEVMCYYVVDHQHNAVIFQVEGCKEQ
jgi:hypothetical protein